jgi:hypothetical protein
MYRALIHCLYFKNTVSCFQTCNPNIYRHDRTKDNIIANLDALCSTLKSNLASKCQFTLSFCGLVYITIRIPAYPSTDSSITGERQIGKNFGSSGHHTIVVVSQNVSEGT